MIKILIHQSNVYKDDLAIYFLRCRFGEATVIAELEHHDPDTFAEIKSEGLVDVHSLAEISQMAPPKHRRR